MFDVDERLRDAHHLDQLVAKLYAVLSVPKMTFTKYMLKSHLFCSNEG